MYNRAMRHRAYRIALCTSIALLVLVLAISVAGFWIDPWKERVSIGKDLHAAVWNRNDNDVRFVFYNDIEGPYTGSIIQLDGQPPLDRHFGFGDGAGLPIGIYYRYFRYAGLPTSATWTLSFSVWYPIVAFGILPVIALRRWRRDSQQPVATPGTAA